jgi:hypothetical protein
MSLTTFAILPVVYLTRGIDFSPDTATGSSNLFYLRIAYGAVQVVLILLMFLVKSKIDGAKQTTLKKEIKVKAPKVS